MITTTKKLALSYEDLEDIVTSHFYAHGALSDNEFITLFDMDIPLNDDGMVEVDVEVTEMDIDMFEDVAA